MTTTLCNEPEQLYQGKVTLLECMLTRKDLLAGLKAVEKGILKRKHLPILAYVLIEGKNGTITFTTTNLEIALFFSVSAVCLQDGSIALPYEALLRQVKKLKKKTENVTILATGKKDENGNVSGHQAVLTAPDGKNPIAGMDAQEFPALSSCIEQKMASSLTLDREMLARVTSEVAITVAQDDSRPAWTGIDFSVEQGKLWIAATDGDQMSYCVLDGDHDASFKALFPAKAFLLAMQALPQDQDQITLSVNEQHSQGLLEVGPMKILFALIVEAFPAYRAILPKEIPTHLLLDRSELLNLLLRLESVVLSDSAILTLMIADGMILLAAGKQESDRTYEAVKCYQQEGEERTVLLNWHYLVAALKAMTSTRIFFDVLSLQPCILSSEEQRPGQQMKHVIMPMQPGI